MFIWILLQFFQFRREDWKIIIKQYYYKILFYVLNLFISFVLKEKVYLILN